MPRFQGLALTAVLAAVALFAFSDSALSETIELVTYYPSQANTGDLHVRSLTVGDAYRNENPGDGEALVFDRLGIGMTDPRVPLDSVGPLTVSHDNADARNHQIQLGTTLPYGAPIIGFWANVRDPAGGVNMAANSLNQRGAAIAVDAGYTGGRMMFTAAPRPIAGRTWQPQSDTTALMMIALDTGDVGINTTTPQPLPGVLPPGEGQVNLDIRRNLTVGGPTVANTGSVNWRDYTTGAWWHLSLRANGNLEMHTRTNPNAAAVFPWAATLTGNVGIGTTNPTGAASPANGQATGNLDANDVFLRSRNQWVSQSTRVASAELSVSRNYSGRAETVLLTVPFTASGGRPVYAIGKVLDTTDSNSSPDFRNIIRLYRRQVGNPFALIDSWVYWEAANGSIAESAVVMDVEVLSAGNYEFELRATNELATTTRTAQVGSTKLIVMEL